MAGNPLASLTKGRNRYLVYGVGAAAAVGAVVLVRRKSTGSTSTTASGTQSTGGVSTFDSTGTDLATAIGNLGAGLQQQIGDFLNQSGASKGAGAIPTGNGGAGKPTGTPPAHKSPGPSPKYVTVSKGTTVDTILSRYHLSSLTAFRNMNAGVVLLNKGGQKRSGKDAATYYRLAGTTKIRIA